MKMKSILSKSVQQIMHNKIISNVKKYQSRLCYLDSLIKCSELCLTSGLRSNAFGKELSDLCLDILRKDSQIWFQEFQQYEDLLELDQRIEYFLQNCLLIIENSKQDEKIIMMSLTHLSCIDYPKDDRLLSLGARCVLILKNLLTKSEEFKDLVEKSILEIIIHNIKESDWMQLKEIQVNGIISFLEIPNIALLFLQDQEIFPLMHRWIYQISEFIALKTYYEEEEEEDAGNNNENDVSDSQDASDNNSERKDKPATGGGSSRMTLTNNFNKAYLILQLIDMCMKNSEIVKKFCWNDSDKNRMLKIYDSLVSGFKIEQIKFHFQGEQFIRFIDFQIVVLSLMEKFNIVGEENLNEGFKSHGNGTGGSGTASNTILHAIPSITNILGGKGSQASLTEIDQELGAFIPKKEIDRIVSFAMKDIKNQLEFKEKNSTQFLMQMENLMSDTRMDQQAIEKRKLICQIRHFAQLIKTAGSFQGQTYANEIAKHKQVKQKQKSDVKESQKPPRTLTEQLLDRFIEIYKIPLLTPLIVSACCTFTKYYFKYHVFSSIEDIRGFLGEIKSSSNLLQYLEIEGSQFDEFIQLGQLHLSDDVFFENFMNDAITESESTAYFDAMISNPVVLQAMLDILELFNFFYVRNKTASLKIIPKGFKQATTPAQISKTIKKEVRDVLDQKQRKTILLNLLNLSDPSIRVQACRQLLSLKSLKDEKTNQLSWSLEDLRQLQGKLNLLFQTQKGLKKEQDISFIILIFCKFFTEVDSEMVEEVISEIGQQQFEILINILEDCMNSATATQSEVGMQNSSDLCISCVFLIRKLISNTSIREQNQKDSILRRIKQCIIKESTIFNENFPPLFVEDLCMNISALIECFESNFIPVDSLPVFRLMKRLGDCLEGYAYRLNSSDDFDNNNNNMNEDQKQQQQSFFGAQVQHGIESPKNLNDSQRTIDSFGKQMNNQANTQNTVEGIVAQIKIIQQLRTDVAVMSVGGPENPLIKLANSLISSLEQRRGILNQVQSNNNPAAGGIAAAATAGIMQAKAGNAFTALQNKINQQKNIFKSNSLEVDSQSLQQQSQQSQNQTNSNEGASAAGNLTNITTATAKNTKPSIKDFASIRTKYDMIEQIKAESNLWERKEEFTIDPNLNNLFQIQHNLFSSQQGIQRILAFLANNFKDLDKDFKNNEAFQQLILVPVKQNLVPEKKTKGDGRDAGASKIQQNPVEFLKQHNDANMMGSSMMKLRIPIKIEFLDGSSKVSSHMQKFSSVVNSVSEVQVLKMFTKQSQKSIVDVNLEKEAEILSNKRVTILSAFLRCIYFSIKKAPTEIFREQAVLQAKNIHIFRQIAALCKRNGFIKASIGCKFLLICDLIFSSFHRPKLASIKSAMKRQQQQQAAAGVILNKGAENKSDDPLESDQQKQVASEQVEIIYITLTSIQEMIELLNESLSKVKSIETADIKLLHQIVRSINHAIQQLQHFQPVTELQEEFIRTAGGAAAAVNAAATSKQQSNQAGQAGCSCPAPKPGGYPHRKHLSLILSELINQDILVRLSYLLLYPYENLKQTDRVLLDEATVSFSSLFANYFSLCSVDMGIIMASLNQIELELDHKVKQQNDNSVLQRILSTTFESSLAFNLIDDLYFKDSLISSEKETLCSWSWCYIRRDDEKDNQYRRLLMLQTNAGFYILSIQQSQRCKDCSVGSLCGEKYKLEYVISFIEGAISKSKDAAGGVLMKLEEFSQGFSKQQLKISASYAVESMFSSKQQILLNFFIVFSTIERGINFCKSAAMFIPKKFNQNDSYISFIFSILSSTDNVKVEPIQSLNQPIRPAVSAPVPVGNNNAQKVYKANDLIDKTILTEGLFELKKGNLSFFIATSSKEPMIPIGNGAVPAGLTILVFDKLYPDEVILLKEKSSQIAKLRGDYKSIVMQFYNKRHIEKLLTTITQDNLNYGTVATEYAIYCDKLYDNLMNLFEIQRVNLKRITKFEFPNTGDASIVLNTASTQVDEKDSKISRTKVFVKDMGDDYVDVQRSPRFPHLRQGQMTLYMTSELSRQTLKRIGEKSLSSLVQETKITDVVKENKDTENDADAEEEEDIDQKQERKKIFKKFGHKKQTYARVHSSSLKLKSLVKDKVIGKSSNLILTSLSQIRENLPYSEETITDN